MSTKSLERATTHWNDVQQSGLDRKITAIRYPCGSNSSASMGEERSLSIREFTESIVHISTVKSTDDESIRKAAKVNKVPLWFFGSLNGGPLAGRKAGMHTGTCLVFDLDGDGSKEKEEAMARSITKLRNWGKAAAIQTTLNHGLEGKGSRYRVLLAINVPYLAAHHEAIREAIGYRIFERPLLEDALQEIVDTNTEDPTRSYFQAAHWADMPSPEVIYVEGPALFPLKYICRRTHEGSYFMQLAADLRALGYETEDAVRHINKENKIINLRCKTVKHDQDDIEKIVEKVFACKTPELSDSYLREIYQSVQDNKRKKIGRAPKSIVELRNLLSYYNPRYEVSEDKAYITRSGVELCLDDNALEDMRGECELVLGHIYTAKDILSQLRAEAAHRPFDRVKDYLQSLPQWDGVERWKNIVNYRKVDKLDFIMSKFMERWAIATVRTRFEPNYPVQEVPLLIGGQGRNKSFMLKALCPNERWFTDGVKHFERNAQNSAQLEGKWIVLFDELDKFATKAGNGELKDGVTKVDLSTQKKYALFQDDFKKRFTYISSCNPITLWRDPEGQRRFLPMEIVSVWSKEKVAENRDQLWAEAYEKHLRGDRTWYPDEERDAIMELNMHYYDFTDTMARLAPLSYKLKEGMEYSELLQLLYPGRERLVGVEKRELTEALRVEGWRIRKGNISRVYELHKV